VVLDTLYSTNHIAFQRFDYDSDLALVKK
jgi:hypothetical protein